MIAAAIDTADLRRWTASAIVVLGLHGAIATLLVGWHEPVPGDEGPDAVLVDMSSIATPRSESQQDLAPGPDEQPILQPPAPPQEKVEEEEKPKVEPPPVPDAAVTLPQEQAKPEPPKPVPQPTTPTAPPRQRTASAAAVRSWQLSIVKQIERHKGYSQRALARRETGTAQLSFSIDREGRLLQNRIVRSSGSEALDEEAMATLRRAQPFPPPPRDLDGATFDFTVPVKFNIR
ncbi:MAG TPA: energy transducer TonB [Xanthobacteraceae bacterium]|nr:energy transducer TonB [Xanthobacteraceae bacterium]